MLPMQGQRAINVVAIDSSDDEAETRNNASSNKPASGSRVQRGRKTNSSPQVGRPLESRSFWKAGAFEIDLTKSAPPQGQLEHARVHPKFLHSNATSHKWAFGALAELMDNAVDEMQNGATFVKVDRIYNMRDNSPALLIQDDGGGMDPESLRKCMSLGYSSKKSNTTIGQYGNGFKTSTMRLGADVIVFSRASCSGKATQSVGLLSYTFLRRTGQDDVIVPMVDFNISNHWAEPIIYGSQEDWCANLKTIMEWSPFASKDELMLQFDDIGSHGTKIIIYNLWLNDEGIFELNFDDDEEDIRLRDEANQENLSRVHKAVLAARSHISYRLRYSLRAYASILYLRKFANFQIILRGKPVEQYIIAEEIKYPKEFVYRPQLASSSKEVSAKMTVGFIKEAPAVGVSGCNIYHKNRLIRPFWKVSSENSHKGNGVVGVVEANFIEPAHDKQDFERSTLFFRLELKLKQMIMEYWRGNCHLMGYTTPGSSTSNMQKKKFVQSPVGGVANVSNQTQSGQHVGTPASAWNQVQLEQSFGGVVNVSNQTQSVQHVGTPASAWNQVQLEQSIGGVANVPNQTQSGQHVGTPASAWNQVQLEQSITSLAADTRRDFSNMQPGTHFGVSSHSELPADQPFIGLTADSVQGVSTIGGSLFTSVDQICDSNIQLFMKCEEHVRKENELKQTVEELEKQIEEAKRKCALLSSHIETQKKLMTLPTQKF